MSETPTGVSRIKLVAIILGLAITLTALIVFGFLYMQSRTVDHYFQAGYDSYDTAFNKLDRALDDLANIKLDKDSKDLNAATKRISRKIPSAIDDLSDAGKDFRRMERSSFIWWEKQAASLSYKSANFARDGAQALEKEIQEIERMMKTTTSVAQSAERFSEGFKKANEAITNSNNNKFAEATQSASEADKLFSESRDLMAEADKTVPGAGLREALPGMAKGRRWAASVIKMAEAGSEKKIDDYNALVRENNELSESVAKVARKQVLADPGGWFDKKIDELNDKVAVHFRKADLWREKALKIWRKNI